MPVLRALLLLLLSIGIIYGQQRDSKIVHLLLTTSSDAIVINSASIEQGFRSGDIQDLRVQPSYKVLLYDRSGNIVYSNSFRDPALIFFDELRSGEELTGGIVFSSSGIVDLKIPFIPNTELQIVSPAGKILLYQSLESIINANRNKHKVLSGYETIHNSGDPQYMIDILVMGDGYTVNDTAKFRQDVQSNIVDYLLKFVSPYKEYQSYFNVHLVQIISEESGADHPERNPPVYKNTYFDATYNLNNMARLIGCNYQKVYNTAQNVFPRYDKIILLVNDDTYGGSGGSFPLTYTGYYGKQVLAHEFGHSFGGLLDEYLYSNNSGYISGCNCDNDSSHIKWKSWIDKGTQGVDMFKGCSYANYFRPTSNGCMMNQLKNFYCPVCIEEITKSINRSVNVIKSYLPAEGNQEIHISSKVNFLIEPLFASNENLVTRWFVNLEPASMLNNNSFEFSAQDTGMYSIAGTVTDTTEFVLTDPRYEMMDYVEWKVKVVPDPIPEELIVMQNYPNPFNSITIIKYSVPEEGNINLKLYNELGQEKVLFVNEKKSKGWHQYQFNGNDLSSGVYFYSISNGKTTVTNKMILLK